MEELTAEQLSRAAERVREMQRRATAASSGAKNPPQFSYANNMRQNGNKQQKPSQKREPKPNPQPSNPAPTSHGGRGVSGRLLQMLNFKNFEFNSDTSLLLGILFLLSSQEADEMLVLALIYIML